MKFFGIVIGLAILAGLAYLGFYGININRGAVEPSGIAKVLVDQSFVLSSGELKGWVFDLDHQSKVTIEYEGQKGTGKGFRILTLPESQYDLWQKKEIKRPEGFLALSEEKTQSGILASVLEPGRYAVVIQNNRNLINSARIQFKVSIEAGAWEDRP
jgi:hypothetical protein